MGQKKGWSYFSDPYTDYYAYANETLKVFINQSYGSIGAGDCDDFAILMSSLVGAIGGTARIVLSKNYKGGHAYAEVYLGQLCTKDDSNILGSINWLKKHYSIDKIWVQVDSENKNVWLNLDYGKDEKGYSHPGGNYFVGAEDIITLDGKKASMELPPLRIISIEPRNPRIHEDVILTGSEVGQWTSSLEGLLCRPTNSCWYQFKKPGIHMITLKVDGDIWPPESDLINVTAREIG
jgi:hypothetical protein